MGFDYLKGNYWKDITREERLFCSHLYHKINEPSKTKQFIEWLNKTKSPIDDLFKNNLNLDENTEWEVAYESCFYRDLLKFYGFGVKEHFNELSLVNNIGEDAVNLIKRTFDLALFSNDTIVIIEAKASNGLTTKQFQEFEIDERLINGVFKFLKIKMPKIVFIILAADKYFKSPSFTSPKGVGKLNLIDKQSKDFANKVDANFRECKIDGLISWKQLLNSDIFKDEMFDRAERVYNN